MKFSIAPLFDVSAYKDERLFLVNGICVLKNGNIVVADGGNDKIRLFSPSGYPLESVGGTGVGQYHFKEPVGVFSSPDGTIFVADWHNHRIVIFSSDLEYRDEFGHLGPPSPPGTLRADLYGLARFLRALGSPGSYITAHFVEHASRESGLERKAWSLGLVIRGLSYLRNRHGSIMNLVRYIRTSQFALDKPNGVAFLGETILVSQKNSKCLSIHSKVPPYPIIERWFAPTGADSFGRLGNILCDETGNILVCDEPAGVIWRIDSSGRYIGKIQGEDSGTGTFSPFSCCLVSTNLLCVCGGLNFQVIDTASNKVIFKSENIGELHGVAFDAARSVLYAADRLHGMIRAYSVTLG
jgi:DNA-binding beta-propeller fold protein YncE